MNQTLIDQTVELQDNAEGSALPPNVTIPLMFMAACL